MTSLRQCLLGLGLVSALVGCGTAVDGGAAGDVAVDLPTVASPAAEAAPARDACSGTAWSEGGPHLTLMPPGTEVTAGSVCRYEKRRVAGSGVWQYADEMAIVGGLGQLVAAYSVADERASGGACPAVAYGPLTVTLVTAAGPRIARAPQGPCGEPQAAARRAYDALKLKLVASKRLGQSQSELGLRTGCSESYKDVISLEADATVASLQPNAAKPSRHVCIYEVEEEVPGGMRVGRLTDAVNLSPRQVKAILGQLERRSPPCAGDAHKSFALLTTGQDYVTIARDGCGRALWQSGVGVAPPSVGALLTPR